MASSIFAFSVPTRKMPSAHYICRRIYTGGFNALLDLSVMQRIGGVLSLVEFGKYNEAVFPLCVQERPHLRIPLKEENIEELERRLPEILEFIEQAKAGNVLIHCVAGHSRSSMVAACYLAWKYPENFESVEQLVEFVKKRNPEAKFSQLYLDFLENHFFSTTSIEDS